MPGSQRKGKSLSNPICSEVQHNSTSFIILALIQFRKEQFQFGELNVLFSAGKEEKINITPLMKGLYLKKVRKFLD